MELGLTARQILFYVYSRLLHNKETRVSELAKITETSKPNISQITGHLCEIKYLENRPYKPVILTNNGLVKAEQIYRKVLLIESFLFKTLSMPFFQCRSEAFKWESEVYGSTIQAIQAKIEMQIGLSGDPFLTDAGTVKAACNFFKYSGSESGGRPFKICAIQNIQTADKIYLEELSNIYLEQVTAKNDPASQTVIIFHGQTKYILPERYAFQLLIQYL